ncbi:MAG: hypothetical protein E6K46_11635 [Gammaproteobacteria bacterium]|nr:MAG: hypothetical protein E6K46_11635 [Gammaproteobacteria bacterium]
MHNARRLVRLVLCAALLAPVSHTVCAFTITISNGPPKTVYLQVGVGGFIGQYNTGGTPANNATVNHESVSVAAAAVGNGTAQAMTTDSTVGASSYDGFAFCNVPAQLYIGGFYRTTTAGGGSVNVTASVPAALVDAGGDTLSFARISWTTGGNGDSGSEPFPAGSFSAGAVQTVGTITQNQWAESCWTFSYSNTTFPAAGTYTGRVLYTLTAP